MQSLSSVKRRERKGAHLKIVGLVVVHVESAEKLAVPAHAQLLCPRHTVVDGLPSKFLHLDVVKLTEVTEPLDQL